MRQLGPVASVACELVMGTDPGWAEVVPLNKLDPPLKPEYGAWQVAQAALLLTDICLS